MINTNEIRINNWLHHNESWCYRERQNPFLKGFDFQFDEQDWYAIGECTMSLDNVSGIPITYDWLLRFGWTQAENYQQGVLSLNGVRMMVHQGKWTFNDLTRSKIIEHVHQLQNLYFALTGQELELKN